MATMEGRDGRTFSVERDMIDVTSCHRPDEHWRHVDPSGHEHQWFVNGQPAETYHPSLAFTLPTLELVVDVEGSDPDADVFWPAITHYECRRCRVRVEPGYTADRSRVCVPGLPHFSIDGQSVSEAEFRAEWERIHGPIEG